MPTSLVSTGVQFPDNTIQTTAASGGSSYTTRSSNYTAVSGDKILANTSGGSFTVTLPASPSTGDTIEFVDSHGTFQLNPLIIARNGKSIMGDAENLFAGADNAGFGLVYNGTEWRIF